MKSVFGFKSLEQSIDLHQPDSGKLMPAPSSAVMLVCSDRDEVLVLQSQE